MLFTYMINQQMHVINMLNHMLLFLANMFHSPLWPSSECLITTIQLKYKNVW